MEDLKSGKAVGREQLMAQHPKLAVQLDACLAGVEFIYRAKEEQDATPRRLGDFLIRGEIGRGGMGAVYEAEQLSLGRKVALKVLRFGVVSDAEAIDRFKREAETIANLHHTNIVPIFSVGNEGGVNYYAMQFIDGPSLDRVVRSNDGASDAATVASWGLQAAEALAHAHERGVIHRDVKPSNLLLDEDGRIWLTDFGLAKRQDDVTLSMTGVLLGTPRYMSPEQAESTLRTIDHRTDIYSLGATLYELVTGQPVFTADTPHGVINQILTNEPLPPSRHQPGLPRDFETVLLKCLSKEASQRYETAQDLAEDLRAIVEDRPIRARRPHVVERAARWLKTHKRSVLPAATAVLSTLLIAALIVGARSAYWRWQQATLSLATKTPGLIAEINGDHSKPFVEVLPTQEPLQLPSGKIGLHVLGEGQLSQRFEMSLSPGERKAVDISLDDRRIGRRIPITRSFRLLPFTDGVDPILLNENEIQRWDAERGAAVWTLDMSQQRGPLVPDGKPIRWPWRAHRTGFSTGDKFDHQPFVLGQLNVNDSIDSDRRRRPSQETLDLDQDGEVDVVIASREEARVLAVSGRTGKVLWVSSRGTDIDEESSETPFYRTIRSASIAAPLAARDLNDDSVPDLIAIFGDIGNSTLRQNGPDLVPASCWIEAISGRTGKTLWRSEIHRDWLQPPQQSAEVPYAFRWFVSLRPASSSRSWGASQGPSPAGMVWRSRDRQHRRTGQYCVVPDAPRLVNLTPATHIESNVQTSDAQNAVSQSLVFMAGTRVVQIDPRSGEPMAEPQDTGILTGRPARYADMDGDGQLDIVLCEKRPDKKGDEAAGMSAATPQMRIAVWSIANDKLLWQRDFTAHWPRKMTQHVAAPEWPLVSDLDGDGVCEIMVPDGTTNLRIHAPRPKAPRGGLAVIDGATGEQRWKRGLFAMDQQLDHFLAGPDLDDDGIREVFVVSLWGSQFDLFVDALSGADGRTLWRRQYPLNRDNGAPNDHWIGRLTWCSRGIDGWPQLAVPVHPEHGSEQSGNVYLISAGTGRLQQIAAGADAVWSGDVNRDGIDDWCAYVPPKEAVRRNGEASLYQGLAAEYWRRLGDERFPICDLDGDGIRDLLRPVAANRLEASSGRTGKLLWSSELDVAELRQFEVLSMRGDSTAGLMTAAEERRRDLDHDGSPDLIIGIHSLSTDAFSPLHAISGRTGAKLWSANIRVNNSKGSPMAQICDLDRDGLPELVYVAAINLMEAQQRRLQSSNEVQLRLIVLSAKDGKVRWQRPLSPAYGKTPQFNPHRLRVDLLRIESPTADLNGDGVLDLVIPSETDVQKAPLSDQPVELIAVSGADGSLLWRHKLPKPRRSDGRLVKVPPVAAVDLDGDGVTEVVTLEFEDVGDAETKRVAKVRALEGGTGRIRWQWQYEVDSSYGEIDDIREVRTRPRPIVLKTKSGRPRIGIVLRSRPSKAPFEVAVLDHEGQPLSLIPLVAVQGYAGDTHDFYPQDVDQDGSDEIVFWNRQALLAVRADASRETLWKLPIKTRLNAQLEGLLPGSTNSASHPEPTVAVLRQGSGDNSLIGIDVAAGTVRWVCAGPTARSSGGWLVPERVELLGRMDNTPPLGFFEFGSLSICRQGADTTVTGMELATANGDRTEALLHSVHEKLRTAAVLSPDSPDPRHFRDLPWRFHLKDPDVRQMLRVARLGVIYCFTLVLIPGAILLLLVRRRKLDWPVVFAIVAGCISIYGGLIIGDAERETHMRTGRLVLAVAILPFIQFVGEPICRVICGQWRRALGWLIASNVVSIALAVVVLTYHGNSDLALQPMERYSLRGWYLIGLWGAYLTGILMLLSAVGRHLVKYVRARLLRPNKAIVS